MSVKNFTTQNVEDWTVPAGVTSLVCRATGPGLNGSAPTKVAGTGGVGFDGLNNGGDGTLNSVGLAGRPVAYNGVDGDNHFPVVGTYEFAQGDLDGDKHMEIYAAGGHGKFAGGGAGGYVSVSWPEEPTSPAATLVVSSNGGVSFTIHHLTVGDVTFTAFPGEDAVGHNPGVGGSTEIVGDSDGTGYTIEPVDGGTGDPGVYGGGGGGAGGNFVKTESVTVEAGKVIRCSRGTNSTTVVYDPDGSNALLAQAGSGDEVVDTRSDFPTVITYLGGLGASAISTLGCSGGTPATESSGGSDGSPDIGDENSDGVDASVPGEGGGGPGVEATHVGVGLRGFASLTYVAATNESVGLSSRRGWSARRRRGLFWGS